MKETLAQRLRERDENFLLRDLSFPRGLDFCSNDYLSFANDLILQNRIHEKLKGVPAGGTSSRLLRGHFPATADLEATLARFSGREAALFFSSGYQANLAAMSTLLNPQTLVFSDEYNHASIIDGIRLSGSAKQIFSHNSIADLEEKLKAHAQHPQKFVVVESLYSMTGERAPLTEISELCLNYQAQLIVDEAHATGVYGAGLVEKAGLTPNTLLTVHCAGKAFGVAGAWLASDVVTRDFLVNFARPFIYSTAPSPLVVTALRESLIYWNEVGDERAELCLDKSREFCRRLKNFMTDEAVLGDGPIVYLNLQESSTALSWSLQLQDEGFDVRAIRYPTVPQGRAGLRISIHANQNDADIQQLVRLIQGMVLEC